MPPPGPRSDVFETTCPAFATSRSRVAAWWIGMTVCKTNAGNSLDETGRVPRGPGNSTGEPGNRPEDVGDVPRGISHSRGA